MSIYNKRYYGLIVLPNKCIKKELYDFFYYHDDKVPCVQIFQFKETAKQAKKTYKNARIVTCELLRKYKGNKDVLKVSYGVIEETYISLKGPYYSIVAGSWLKGKTQLAKAFIEVCEAQKHKIEE